MVGFGGPFAYRDWVRSWSERLNRLDAYLRKQRAEEPDKPPNDGENPDDYRHRRN